MKTCLFTVSFAGFWGQRRLSLEQSIDKVAELGFAGIEIMGKRPHLSPLDYSLEDCAKLKKQLDARGLSCAAVAAYTNFTAGMESGEVPLVDMQVGYVEELARRASVLGCDLVRIFSSYERSDVPFPTQWQLTVAAIRECCDRAAKHGVKIGLQNHHDIGAPTRTLAELIRQVNRPNLLPMLDCWSVHLRGEAVAAAAESMAAQMRFTTVADYVVLPRTKYQPALVNYVEQQPPFVVAVPMGSGDLPYDRFFAGLKRGGFDGWVSYEMCSPLRDGGELATLDNYAGQFLAYMKNIEA